MRVDAEVRSSGPGPRVVFRSRSADPGWVASAVRRMSNQWKRTIIHKGRERRVTDGVCIIIRRAP